MDPCIPTETTVVVEQNPHGTSDSTVIVQNQAPLCGPPMYPGHGGVTVTTPGVHYPAMHMGAQPTVVVQGQAPYMGYPGQSTVVIHNTDLHYDPAMEEDRDDDGYIIDDEYYYYDKGYYTDADYYSKDHYWKYFKTHAGEKFKYSRK